jgi:hypothetical protein
VAGYCTRGKETSSSIECRELFDLLRYERVLENDSVPFSYLVEDTNYLKYFTYLFLNIYQIFEEIFSSIFRV